MVDHVTSVVVVNGAQQQFTERPGQTLLSWLRDVGVTGPKLGCGEGACGACTVLIGSRPVRACQVEAASAVGQRITTAEGLAEEGILHPVQQAWLETGALQCGYCTPGWLMGTAALLARVAHPDDARINAELDGHVCRCCAYPRIRRAIHRAAELMDQPELLEPVPSGAPAAAILTPAEPWDLARARPESFARAMPEGLLAVVADSVAEGGPGFGGPDDAWVHVGADGSITAFTGKVEAGQGTRTALSLLVAEELAVPAGMVRLAMADTDVSPFDLGTFGSRGMPHAAPPLRTAAAAAFRLLTEAAAQRFGLPGSDLSAGDGMIAGPDGAPNATYAELVAGQRRVEHVPADAPVTPAAAWRHTAGRPARAAGAAAAVTGTKSFPSDLRLDGMLYGRVLHAPAAGATLRQAGTARAAAIPGVIVLRDESMIGVVAPDDLTASAALAAIDADWAGLDQQAPGPADLPSYLRAHQVPGEGRSAAYQTQTGDPGAVLETGAVRLAATYHAAYVAHVPLEPRSALARWEGDQLTVWAATSTPFRARQELAAELGISEASVHVIVPDFGGGFGGKHGSAVALEAARLARAAGQPVKVQWTRADEFTAGYLRPAAVIDVSSSADAAGHLRAWSFTNIHAGAAGLETPYRVPHRVERFQPASSTLASGSYRALAATANNFARESHMDELADALGIDPVTYRHRHLDDERLAAVLDAAAAAIGWPGSAGAAASGSQAGSAGEAGKTGAGIALGFEKGGRVATAARVHIAEDGTLTIRSLVTAVDCGAIVNPDGLANQVEGAVVMGLGPALFEHIDFAGGQILNASMSEYRVPRLADVPADLRVVLLDQPEQPSAGGGEAPIVAVAPAIANAIFRACGVRLRSMPLVPSGRVPQDRYA
jgi:nicotinate dehydrogenase subunit B